MLWDRLNVWWDRFLVPVDDPGSRLFHLNIVVSLLLVALWLFWTSRKSMWPEFIRLVFRRKYWWNRSTKLDYQIYILNGILKVLLLIPFLDFSFEIARMVGHGLVFLNGGEFMGLKASTTHLFAFTVVAFVWDDFLRFFQHFIMHRIPFLWRIHSVHHSARVLTPVTLYRNHPLESAIATLRNSLSLGVMTGLFLFLFEARFSVVTLFGVNIFGFLFNLLGANLRHSHVPISFGPFFEKIFISPKQHQIHHSSNPDHFDRNLGVSLAIWDRLFGSLILSQEVDKVRVGLPESHHQSLLGEMTLRRKSN